MRNNQKPVAPKSSVAFSNTPTARNAVVNWYWAEQFSSELLSIISNLDWRFIQYMGKLAEMHISEWSKSHSVSEHTLRAHTSICALSAFLKEHESHVAKFQEISKEIIALHHVNLQLDSERLAKQSKPKSHDRKSAPSKRPAAKKRA